MDTLELVKKAIEARNNSYTPYSHWTVGAALLTSSGEIFIGSNIENAAFGPSVCAERVAIFKAVSEGYRNFEAIAVVGGKEGEDINDFCYPCGVCRQVMSEFCAPDFNIIVAKSESEIKICTLDQLLPDSFGPSTMN